MYEVNEKSTLVVTAAFFDENDAPVTPSAATAAIHDVMTKTPIRSATALTGLSTTKAIEITTAENSVITKGIPKERHVLTIEYDYGSSKHGTACYEFDVVEVLGVQSAVEVSESVSPSSSASRSTSPSSSASSSPSPSSGG